MNYIKIGFMKILVKKPRLLVLVGTAVTEEVESSLSVSSSNFVDQMSENSSQ